MHTGFTNICRKMSYQLPVVRKDVKRSLSKNAELAYLIVSHRLKGLEDFFQSQNEVCLNPIKTTKENAPIVKHSPSKYCLSGYKNLAIPTTKYQVAEARDDSFTSIEKCFASRGAQFRKITSIYGLFTEQIRANQNIPIKKPDGFKGTFQIDGTTIEMNTEKPEITFDIADSKYRFCKNKVNERVAIKTESLGAFGQIPFATSSKRLIICYRRSTLGADKDFCVENSGMPLQALISTLDFLGVPPRQFLYTKIDMLISGLASSKDILMDISFYSKFLDFRELELQPLVRHLQKCICEASCDNHAYDLYSLVVFLARISNKAPCAGDSQELPGEVLHAQNSNLGDRKPAKHFTHEIIGSLARTFLFDAAFRCRQDMPPICLPRKIGNDLPIRYDAILSIAAFASLSRGIASSLASSLKRNPDKACHQVHRYIGIGLRMNADYVKKIIPPRNSSTVGLLLAYKSYKALKMNTDTPEFRKCLGRVCDKFCGELNSLLKHGLDVTRLYDELVANFGFCDINLLSSQQTGGISDSRNLCERHLESGLKSDLTAHNSYFGETLRNRITMVHTSRIRKAHEIGDLQRVYRSIQRFNKIFLTRDESLEQKLKDKAKKCMKDMSL